MPRFGFAYSVTPRTVLRGGYGIFFDALGITNVHVNQTGWSRSTDLVLSVDNGQNYLTSLTNPFPGGFLAPLGSGGGLSTNLGQSVSFFREDLTSSYMQRWQVAIQQQLPKNHLIEVSYVGNRGTGIRVGRDLDPIPRQYLSTQFFRDNATNNTLGAAVANPFYPLLPGTGLSGTTVNRSQLLRPYPQFTGNTPVGADENIGYSWYHSMQVRIERRFSAGLNASMSYTWSKMMEATGFLNATDPRLEEVISNQDRTHRLVVTWLYELPFGRGKPWANSANAVVSRLAGGWQIQGIFTAQSGAALGFGDAIFIGDLKNIPLPKDQRNVDRWFNIDAGFDRVNANQRVSHIREMPSRFSGIRSDGPNNWDLSVLKNTQVRERLTIQFRAEAINAFNHPQFTPGSVNTTPTSTAFGRTTIEFAWPRVIQFGLKALF
jgi:hypothetical protein